MSRQNIPVNDHKSWVFNRLASSYHLRPTYPQTLVDLLAQLAAPHNRVVDLGAGTGCLALPLAERGLLLTAVEPAALMLAELQKASQLGDLHVNCVHATAESTGLPPNSFDLAIVADALHWLTPVRAGAEIARILSPSGTCAIVEVRLSQTPFIQALLARLICANPKARPPTSARRNHLLALAVPNSRRRSSVSFSSVDLLSHDQLRGTLHTISFIGPALGPSATEALLDDIIQIAENHGGAFWPREFTVTFTTR